ncbi:MAG TPA: hypothetical protein PK101_13280, partial [Thauera sp.]|nr:hypothetical protein [Thauera sp.]
MLLAAAAGVAALLAGCSTTPTPVASPAPPPRTTAPSGHYFSLEGEHQTQEMVLFALGHIGKCLYSAGRTNNKYLII